MLWIDLMETKKTVIENSQINLEIMIKDRK